MQRAVKRRVRPGAVILVLAVMAAGAVAVASLGVRLRGTERRLAAGRSQRVLELEPARVTALSVSVGGEARRLVRGAAGWRIAAPVDAPADGAVVARLLAGLAALERRATVAAPGASPERLRSYGLDAPEALLEVTLEDGRSLSLAFGSGTGEDGAMFVQPGSGEVVLVAASARGALLPTLSELAAAPAGRAGQAPGGPRP
jgi:hypothetical protein